MLPEGDCISQRKTQQSLQQHLNSNKIRSKKAIIEMKWNQGRCKNNETVRALNINKIK